MANYTAPVQPTTTAPSFAGNNIDYATFGKNAQIGFTDATHFTGSYVNNGQTIDFTGLLPTTDEYLSDPAKQELALDIAWDSINKYQMPSTPGAASRYRYRLIAIPTATGGSQSAGYITPASDSATMRSYPQAYINAQQYFTANPGSYAYIQFNPTYTPASTSGANPGMTMAQGIEQANLGATAGNLNINLSPAQSSLLLGSLTGSGLTQSQAQDVMNNLTPDQIHKIQAGTPYNIYYNTQNGISSSYAPQTLSLATGNKQPSKIGLIRIVHMHSISHQPLTLLEYYLIRMSGAWPRNLHRACRILQYLRHLQIRVNIVQCQNLNLKFSPPHILNLEILPTLLEPTQTKQQPTTIGSELGVLGNSLNQAYDTYVGQPINNWWLSTYGSPQTKLISQVIAQNI